MAQSNGGHKPPAVKQAAAPIVLDADAAGQGFEAPKMSEQLTPFLRVLESNSKQLKPNQAIYVPGATQGMLLNTATSEFYPGDSGIEWVAVHRSSHYGEWTPIDDGGGFHGIKQDDDPEVTALLRKHGRFKALPTERGTELVQAMQLFVLYAPELTPDMGEAEVQRALLSFQSTKIPAYQRWFMQASRIRYPTADGKLVQPAMWQHIYRVTTIPVSRGGYDYYGLVIGLAKGNDPAASFVPKGSPLFEAAMTFRQQIIDGGVTADYAQMEPGTGREPGEDIEEAESRATPPF
jgi:hypothetical protein